jgi:Dyp-type peroxidase family
MSTATTTVLDLSDIQGDILRAYGNAYRCTTYLFVGFGGKAAARQWIGELADHITNAEPWHEGRKPAHHINVALTATGVQTLVENDVYATFSKEFRDGMKHRAERLGDIGRNDPSGWDAGLGTGEADLLVTVNALDDGELEAVVTNLKAAITAHGHRVVHEQAAHTLGGQREHFGFADGFAQPAIEGATEAKAAGGGVPLKHGDWRSLAPGEFILGYPDEDTVLDPERALPSAPKGDLGLNGTYMVWRKLEQDVEQFRSTVKAAAAHYEGGDEALLRAKVVGRWDDGSPLVTHPDAPAGDFDGNAEGANDFRFHHEDRSGGKCPIGSHIRRSNPRDSIGWEGRLTYRHRIIRRGMPYGDVLPDSGPDPEDGDRGLVFVCFNASISRQFEAIQVQWLNDGNVFGLGHDSDFLMGGEGDGSMVVQGEQPFYLAPQRPFVTLKGGEYLFVPGIAALRALARN